jgi:hypothetical protein
MGFLAGGVRNSYQDDRNGRRSMLSSVRQKETTSRTELAALYQFEPVVDPDRAAQIIVAA